MKKNKIVLNKKTKKINNVVWISAKEAADILGCTRQALEYARRTAWKEGKDYKMPVKTLYKKSSVMDWGGRPYSKSKPGGAKE